ncbi:MAG: hypothetical protein WCF99_18135, partial [Chloroflexales bacterium]
LSRHETSLSRHETSLSRHKTSLSRHETSLSHHERVYKVRSSDLQGSRAGDLTQSRKAAKPEGEEGNTAEGTL